jgi:tetratricopeptide (TPR) repeat protein
MFDVVEPPELSVELPRRPPLTSIERERRLAEIELLQNLRDDDDGAISDLWSLWFAERGPRAESILREADELMGGHVREQLEAERLLRALIEEYGVYFAEPLNRLATLYFTQGRLEEALALNKIVLAVKPWHVGSLSQIVMVYEAMGDSMRARSWARFRLPTISHMGSSSSNNKRRERWTEKAVTDATRLYEQGEVTNSMTFGESDNRFYQKKNTEDDPWQ